MCGYAWCSQGGSLWFRVRLCCSMRFVMVRPGFVVVCFSVWFFVVMCGSQRPPLVVRCESLWVFESVRVPLRVDADCCSSVRFSVFLRGSVCSVVAHGGALSCVAMHGA